MRSLQYTLVWLLAFVSLAGVSVADVPYQMSYQGRLTDSIGVPVDTTADLTILVFENLASIAPLWSETHSGVSVVDGLFDLTLGSVTPIPGSVFDGQVRWLGIKIDGGPLSSPLTPIVSTPYAIHAGMADTAAYAHASPAGAASGWVDDGAIVRLESNGDKVGIGTSSPSENLVVGGDLGGFPEANYVVSANPNFEEYSGFKLGYNADNHATLRWNGDGDQLTFIIRSMGTTYNNNLVLRAGNVGIGVDYPNEPLVLGNDLGFYSGNMVAIGNRDSASFAGLTMGQDSNNRCYLAWDNAGKYMYAGTRVGGTFYGSNLILRNGKVGIGTTDPAGELHVVGSGNTSVQLPADAISDGEIMDEPGIGRTESSVEMAQDMTDLVSQEMDFPSAGYALVMADIYIECYMQLDVMSYSAAFCVSDTPGSCPAIHARARGAGTSRVNDYVDEHLSVVRVFQIPAPGLRTFSVRGGWSGVAGHMYVDCDITVTFFPTWYGTNAPANALLPASGSSGSSQ